MALTVFYFAAAAWAMFSAPSVIDTASRPRGVVSWLIGVLFLIDAIRWSGSQIKDTASYQPVLFRTIDWVGVLTAAFVARLATEEVSSGTDKLHVTVLTSAQAFYFIAPATFYFSLIWFDDYRERLSKSIYPAQSVY